MNDISARDLQPIETAIRQFEEAVRDYEDQLQRPFTGRADKRIDRITALELAKLNFRNRISAIENELTSSIIAENIDDTRIYQLKKENLEKEG